MLEHTIRLRADALELKEREKERIIAEKKEKEESMEEGDGVTGGVATGGVATRDEQDKKEEPEYSVGEDGRPRQHILTDTGMLIPAGYV